MKGHFKLSSGLHSDQYLQCARVLAHPRRAQALCQTLRDLWDGRHPDVIVGPAMGGVVLAFALAQAFDVPGIFAERVDGAFALRRGFSIGPGEKVLIAEDVVTTGGSVRELIPVLREWGADIVGVQSLVHRGAGEPFDVPFTPLVRLDLQVWKPEECPLCAEGIPAVKPGSRPEEGR
ncbi:MAG TPA: orotate phosphoribosyltransferase [Planctomycetes bacterium]|nr:orotate phosphoribosyltransferase [Planctomycetota bacterium]